MTTDTDVMTLIEAAEHLRIHPVTLRRLAGKSIPGAKMGRHWRFSRAALDSMLSRQTAAPPPRPAALSVGRTVVAARTPRLTQAIADNTVRRLLAEIKAKNAKRPKA